MIMMSSGSGQLIREAMEERRQMRQLPEIPWDAWVNILSRLPMISIQQVRSVCKGWRLLLAHPHFTKVHSQKLEQYPALLFFDYPTRCLTHVEIIGDGSNGGSDTTTTTTTDTPSSSAPAVMKLKVVEDYALNPVATCNGVVCFSTLRDWFTGYTPYYVGNPLVDRVQDLARVEELTRNPDEAGLLHWRIRVESQDQTVQDCWFVLPADTLIGPLPAWWKPPNEPIPHDRVVRTWTAEYTGCCFVTATPQ